MWKVDVPMPSTPDELFEWVEKWFQPIGERIEALENKDKKKGVDWSASVAADLKRKIEALEKDVNFHGGINMRFDAFGKFLEKFNKRLKAVEQQLTEILNLGPTITQKKMWLDKIMEIELKVIQRAFEEQIRKQLKTIKGFPDDFEIDWDLRLDDKIIKRLKKLK